MIVEDGLLQEMQTYFLKLSKKIKRLDKDRRRIISVGHYSYEVLALRVPDYLTVEELFLLVHSALHNHMTSAARMMKVNPPAISCCTGDQRRPAK